MITENTVPNNTITKSKLEQWKEAGICFQYNAIVDFNISPVNKYFLFDPTGIPADVEIEAFPLTFKNVEDGPCYVNYYAGSDYSGGTPVTLLNRNGNSTNTPDVVIYEDPTGTTLGVITSQNKVSVGGGFFGIGSGGENIAEAAFIANSSTPLLIELINLSGADVDAEVFFEFCEVTPELK